MAGLGGIQYPIIALMHAENALSILRPGQQYQTAVRSTPSGDLFVHVQGVRIPVPSGAGLVPNQPVLAEVVLTQQGPQLQITPLSTSSPPVQGQPAPPVAAQVGAPAPAPGPAPVPAQPQAPAGQAVPASDTQATPVPTQDAAPAPAGSAAASPTAKAEVPSAPESMVALVRNTVAALGLNRAAPEAAPLAGLLPRQLPPNSDAVRQIIAVLLTRGGTGEDLRFVSATLRQAAEQAPSLEPLLAQVQTSLASLLLEEADGIEPVVRQWTQETAAPIEARIARAIAAGRLDEALEEIAKDLRNVLERVRSDEDLAPILRGTGRAREFSAAVDRVIDRLTGRQLQNLRSLEQSYHFMELPVAPESGLRHAQVHFLGDGRARNQGFDPQNMSVAFDLSTTRLGDLWITLSVYNGRCSCLFRATSPEVTEAIDGAAQELRDALAAAGYPQAQIRADLWNGQRLEQMETLFQRFSGVDLKA